MAIRRAFRLLTDNFTNVFKLLLYRLVMGALFIGLSYFILDLGLRSLLEGEEMKEVVTMAGKFFEALFSGDTSYLASFEENFRAALTALGAAFFADIGSVIGSFVGVVMLYLVFRFLNGMATFGMLSRAGTIIFTCWACGAQALSSRVDEASTFVGYINFKARNGWCRMWQAMSPNAPVP